MTRVHILDLPPSHHFLPVPSDWYPLYINQRYFHDLGITFRFFSAPDPGLNNCDVVFLSSRYFALQTKSTTERAHHLSYIASLKTSTNKIFWFDFRDSTGNTQFEVLPYVDLYLKKQLLRNLSLYTSAFYGNRIYTDFIHRTQGVSDDYTESCVPLLPQFHSKLTISWNPGLLDFRGGLNRHLVKQQIIDHWETRFPNDHHITWQNPLAPRPYHMLARFNINYQRRTVSWQRRHALQQYPGLRQFPPGFAGTETTGELAGAAYFQIGRARQQVSKRTIPVFCKVEQLPVIARILLNLVHGPCQGHPRRRAARRVNGVIHNSPYGCA